MTIHEELNDLYRDCIARLNRMGWAVEDIVMSLELMGEEIDAANNVCRGHGRDGSGRNPPGTTGKAAAVGDAALFAGGQPYIVDPGRQAGAAMVGAAVRLC